MAYGCILHLIHPIRGLTEALRQFLDSRGIDHSALQAEIDRLVDQAHQPASASDDNPLAGLPELAQLLRPIITAAAMRLQTEDTEAEIVQRLFLPVGEGTVYSFGEVRGIVETLRRRRRRSFTLYDELFDQQVICRLRPSQEEMMRQFWGKEVVVTGEIRWDVRSGRPVRISDVHDIQFLPVVPPGSYERARGVWDLGTDQPEILLRRLRDGGEG